MGNIVLVYKINLELILNLYCSGCGDNNLVLINGRDNNVTCASTMEQLLGVVKDGAHLYSTCRAVNNTTNTLNFTGIFVFASVNQQ